MHIAKIGNQGLNPDTCGSMEMGLFKNSKVFHPSSSSYRITIAVWKSGHGNNIISKKVAFVYRVYIECTYYIWAIYGVYISIQVSKKSELYFSMFPNIYIHISNWILNGYTT